MEREGFTSKFLLERLRERGFDISLDELEKQLEILEKMGDVKRKKITIELRRCIVCGMELYTDGIESRFEYEKRCIIHTVRFHYDRVLENAKLTPEQKEVYEWAFKHYNNEIDR